MVLKELKLKELRKKTGLTQKQLAVKMETDQSVISRMENNVFTPSLDMLLMLLWALNGEGFEFTLNDLVEYEFPEGKIKANSTNHLEPILA